MTPSLATLAGYLDGDGSFSHGNVAAIALKSTDRDVVELVAKWLGSISVHKVRPEKDHHRPRWECRSRKRSVVLKKSTELLPWLGESRQTTLYRLLGLVQSHKAKDCDRWLAGLLDAEGSFLVRQWPSRPGRRPSLHVGLEMLDADLVHRAAVLMDSRVFLGHPKTSGRTHNVAGEPYRQSYRTVVTGQRAEELMRRVRPYLFSQRKRASVDHALSLPNLSHHPRLTSSRKAAMVEPISNPQEVPTTP